MSKNALRYETDPDEDLPARHQPLLVHHARAARKVLKRLDQAELRNHRIVVSAITCAEMRIGVASKKATPLHAQRVGAFCARPDAILRWDNAAVDATTDIRTERHGDCPTCHRGWRRAGDE